MYHIEYAMNAKTQLQAGFFLRVSFNIKQEKYIK